MSKIIGIDLGDDGASANDPGDGDTGGNNLQNSPEISSAMLSGDELTITFRVDSTRLNSEYAMSIEFFVADGGGQGKSLIGTATYLKSEFRSNKTIVLTVAGLNVGDEIVATATDLLGNTSEFGAAFTVQ